MNVQDLLNTTSVLVTGEEAHVGAPQALYHQARCNRAERHSEYHAAMERTLS